LEFKVSYKSKLFFVKARLHILLVDDHELVLDGLALLFEGIEQVTDVRTASNIKDALSLANTHQFDFAFLDISIGKEDGRQLFKPLKELQPQLKVVALSSHSESSIIKTAMHLGFDGYLLKSDDATEIWQSISAIQSGNKYISKEAQNEIIEDHTFQKNPELTSRELEILRMIADEKSTKEIATALFVSPKTVENHRMSLMQKLDVVNVAGLVRKGIIHGYIEI